MLVFLGTERFVIQYHSVLHQCDLTQPPMRMQYLKKNRPPVDAEHVRPCFPMRIAEHVLESLELIAELGTMHGVVSGKLSPEQMPLLPRSVLEGLKFEIC